LRDGHLGELPVAGVLFAAGVDEDGVLRFSLSKVVYKINFILNEILEILTLTL
jgi:hypothetical protein